MMKKIFLLWVMAIFGFVSLQAQKYLYLYQHDGQIQKISLEKADSILFPSVDGVKFVCLYRADNNINRLPLTNVDSLVLSDTKLFKGNYLIEKYTVPTMNIEVEGGEDITSKDKADYKNCKVTIDGKGDYADYVGTARIRGRGNSSWLYYPKKPYRIKLDEKAEILGLGSDKDWVLLSNYRDPTMLMNAYGFALAEYMDLHYCNHSRYVEVTLNGEYIGLYQLTEQVEQGGDRVDIDDEKGVLIYVDLDDGPGLSPDATDNFWSSVYSLPVCVKYPDDVNEEQLIAIKEDFAELEGYIKAHNYEQLATRMDIQSFMGYLMIEELIHNVEMQAPRSIYMYKDSDNIYHMGPAWDFDAAFAYNWAGEYGEHWLASHGYFADQGMIYGSDPYNSNSVNRFFLNMFKDARFVQEYKALWNEKKDGFMNEVWAPMDSILNNSEEAYARNLNRWNIRPNYTTEVERLKNYMNTRIAKMTTTIANYTNPVNEGTGELKPQDNTYNDVTQTFTVSFPYDRTDYSGITVGADVQSLCNAFLLTGDAISSAVGSTVMFYGVDSDGTLVNRITAQGYGQWFNDEGDVCDWASGTLFSEFSEATLSFNIGQFPGKMKEGKDYTIQQALVYTNDKGDSYKALFVFNVSLGDSKWSCVVSDGASGGGGQGGGGDEGGGDAKDTVMVINKTLDFSASAGYGGPDLSVDASEFYAVFGYASADEFVTALNSREVALIAIDGSTGEENSNSSAKNGGFWFSSAGDVCGWGSSARVYIEPESSFFSTPLIFKTGVYPGQVSGGDTYTVTIAFKKDNTLVKVAVTFTLTD